MRGAAMRMAAVGSIGGGIVYDSQRYCQRGIIRHYNAIECGGVGNTNRTGAWADLCGVSDIVSKASKPNTILFGEHCARLSNEALCTARADALTEFGEIEFRVYPKRVSIIAVNGKDFYLSVQSKDTIMYKDYSGFKIDGLNMYSGWHTIGFVCDGDSVSAYIDGVSMTPTYYNDYWNPVAGLGLGNTGISGDYDYMTVGSMRAYASPLTAEERAANLAIDNELFF